MKSFVSLFILVLIAPAWLTPALKLGAAQANKSELADFRINHDVLAEDQRLEYVFRGVLQGTGLHGGFVEIGGCSALPKGSVQIKQGSTVRQAMDALVAANPGYQWELNDGVVNLMPRGGAPLLDTRIAKFQINATDREIEAVLQDLLRLQEVRERQAALGLRDGIHRAGGEAVEEHPASRQPVPVRIDLQNLSLQDAFNKIAQQSPNAIWVYHETDCNGTRTYTVDVASDY